MIPQIPSTFHPFPRLPPELRHQIWLQSSFDIPDDPTLYFFGGPREDLLSQGEFPEGEEDEEDAYDDAEEEDRDPDYDGYDGYDDCNLYVPVKSLPSQLFVNREARDAIISWGHDHNRYLRFCKDTQNYVWTRLFHSDFDTLYIPYCKWDEYCNVPGSVMWRPDDDDDCLRYEPVVRIAIPMVVLLNHPWKLMETLLEPVHPRFVFVVCDAPPELDNPETSMLVSQRWELDDEPLNSSSREFRWEGTQDGGSYVQDIEEVSGMAIYERIRSFERRVNDAVMEAMIVSHQQFHDPITGQAVPGEVYFYPVVAIKKGRDCNMPRR